jgi:hypothetical protein
MKRTGKGAQGAGRRASRRRASRRSAFCVQDEYNLPGCARRRHGLGPKQERTPKKTTDEYQSARRMRKAAQCGIVKFGMGDKCGGGSSSPALLGDLGCVILKATLFSARKEPSRAKLVHYNTRLAFVQDVF